MSAWDTTDETVAAFFDRLAAGAFPGKPDPEYATFRQHCEYRERAGRTDFGDAYLHRDNLAEAREELADLGIYALLDSLQAIRDGKGDEDFELVLTMAHHAYLAYKTSMRLAAKRRGAP